MSWTCLNIAINVRTVTSYPFTTVLLKLNTFIGFLHPDVPKNFGEMANSVEPIILLNWIYTACRPMCVKVFRALWYVKSVLTFFLS